MRLTAVAIVVLVALLGSACAGDGDPAESGVASSTTSTADDQLDATSTSTTVPVAEPQSPEEVVDTAVAFLAAEVPRMDGASLMILDFIGRNWELSDLSGARAAARDRLEDPSIESEELALGRLVDPDRPDPDAELSEPTSIVLAAALFCDQVEFDSPDQDRLAALVEGGEYDTTHAALAVGWLTELECDVPDLDATRAAVIDGMATELSSAQSSAAATSESAAVTDLAVEQSAMLHYLGAGDRVGTYWSTQVASARNADGGWGPRASNWHMTMLALWTALAGAGPGLGVPLLLAAG